jgi:hypothetical protein
VCLPGSRSRLYMPCGAVVLLVLLFLYFSYFYSLVISRRPCLFFAVDGAEQAINLLNGMIFPGSMQPLVVRFAESAAEKAARLSRRQRQAQGNYGTSAPPQTMSSTSNHIRGVSAEQLPLALCSVDLCSLSHQASGAATMRPVQAHRSLLMPASLIPSIITHHLPPAPVHSSVCIKGAYFVFAYIKPILEMALIDGKQRRDLLILFLLPLQECHLMQTGFGCMKTFLGLAESQGFASFMIQRRVCATALGECC